MPKELMILKDTEETKPTELMLQIKTYTNTLYYSMLCVLLFFFSPSFTIFSVLKFFTALQMCF